MVDGGRAERHGGGEVRGRAGKAGGTFRASHGIVLRQMVTPVPDTNNDAKIAVTA